jgi:hypothetical protein
MTFDLRDLTAALGLALVAVGLYALFNWPSVAIEVGATLVIGAIKFRSKKP